VSLGWWCGLVWPRDARRDDTKPASTASGGLFQYAPRTASSSDRAAAVAEAIAEGDADAERAAAVESAGDAADRAGGSDCARAEEDAAAAEVAPGTVVTMPTLRPGSLLLFRGQRVMHRVTPVLAAPSGGVHGGLRDGDGGGRGGGADESPPSNRDGGVGGTGALCRVTAILNWATAPGGGVINEYTRLKFFGRRFGVRTAGVVQTSPTAGLARP
jgi:hypothetical protein